jgi:TonB family protein
MKDGASSFRKAFGLSIAVHAAVFGSAFAFAQYGASFIGNGYHTIMVSLVGPGTGGTGRSVAAPLRRPAAPEVPAAPAMDEAARPQEARESGAPESSASSPREVIGDGEADAGSGQHSSGSGGPEGQELSAEQWQEIRSALERTKTYPRLARERGIEGTVLVRFHVLPSGEVDAVEVSRSSGAKVLDDASVKTVYRAAPVPYVAGWIEVPMVYQLSHPEGK